MPWGLGVNMLSKAGYQMRRSPAVLGLVLVNVAVFIAQLVKPGLVDVWGIAGGAGEILSRPWTLLTVIVLHDNAGHLVLMMVMLLVFGVALETITRAGHVVLVYLAGGLAGSLAIVVATAFVGSDEMVGASAAVFAIVAAVAALQPAERIVGSKGKQWALALLLVNVPFAAVSLLSSVAHVAGLAVGAAVGYRLRTATATAVPSPTSS